MIHRFKVYGTVRGQGRPRMRRNGHAYKDHKDREWEDKIKGAYINSNGPHFGSKPVMMAVITHRAMPQSRPKYREAEMDVYKPDGSNVLKSVEDALNGIAYEDDRQIVTSFIVKSPRVRQEAEYIEVMISDEINMASILMKINEVYDK